MRRIVCILIIAIFGLGCSKKKSAEPNPVDEQATIPADCTYVSTASHAFRSSSAQMADEYLCNVEEVPTMECHFFQTAAGKREMQCLGLNASSVPEGCTGHMFGGNRYFFEGSRSFTVSNHLVADAYDCGMAYKLRCFWYEHEPDGTDAHRWQDLQCVDDMPYLN